MREVRIAMGNAFLLTRDASFLEPLKRQIVQGFRNDVSTPDLRASDHAQRFNPVVTAPLVQLMNGANEPGGSGSLLHARLRYFDPVRRRAGIPEDLAALVDSLEADSVSVTLVNLSQTQERTVLVQAGAYGEHVFDSVSVNGQTRKIGGKHFTVRLTRGAGTRLRIAMRRYVHAPSMALPWD